ncbi:MAG TPA: chemotaxis protein CheA [Hyphomicrobiales bacterium]|nr:chemotaxis protein CheA [Hyphomicrobiales bacterium]
MHNSTSGHSQLEEIRHIFISECNDGLDLIEQGLLELERGNNTLAIVNDIFRGAHSIKGGAATFGYTNVAEFTHVLETLLDRVRTEELGVTPPLVQVFLEAVDVLRAMVQAMESGEDYDDAQAQTVQAALIGWLGGEQDAVAPAVAMTSATSTTHADPTAVSAMASGQREAKGEDSLAPQTAPGILWDIHFKPAPDFLRNGNQPQHIFRALAELGTLTLQPLLDGLPDFSAFEPETMYLAWSLTLDTQADAARIREVFDWVELDAEIDITPRQPLPEKAAAPSHAPPPAQEAAVAEQHAPRLERRGGKKDAGSIRVDIEKIDVLLNLVGELVINQAMLNQVTRNRSGRHGKELAGELEQGLLLLERTTRELQEAVMEIRMLPLSVTFSRFPRLVHDLSARLNKQVELKITGEQTELDKTVLERIGDPLLHLIRNALDHGIESMEQRQAGGKPATGEIHLGASHEGGSVVIRVSDDGAGLNTERIFQKALEKGLVEADAKLSDSQIHDLIFRPGFSTADVVTDVSGRGVGMDVVRSNIEEIGGRVQVHSERGKGSTFRITLPLTLAILDGQLIRVAGEVYVLPLLSIVETVQVNAALINVISGREVVYRLRGKAVPVVDMREVCRIAGNAVLEDYSGKQMIIVESERRHVGLIVDELLDQHQVVIKSLETNFVKVPGMLGATILGDGTVSLILDVTTLAQTLHRARRGDDHAVATITH